MFQINYKLVILIIVKGDSLRIKSRSLRDKMLEILHKKVDEMDRQVVITKVKDAKWMSLVVFVSKHDGMYKVTLY